MSRDPDYDYYKTVSLQLSEVLDDIGVNDRLILTRRRLVLLRDTMQNITYGLLGENISTYHFGSQSEGSTTLGLHSDNDVLTCHSEFNIIQDLTEWQRGMSNLLMIKDETTSPGYCLLQRLIPDVPLPTDLLNHKPNSNLAVSRDKVLLKNTLIKPTSDGVINGPAESTWQGILGITDQDNVLALHCKSWPAEAQPWLLQQGIGRWPTEELKNKCKTTGCFVVPVSSKNGQNEELEWRISTSQAERCLMFDLNITQLRCYILMKMILKTSINPQCDGVLSSFMCKNVLFHCIQNAPSNHWVQSNLLPCLMYCLTELQNCVKKENCPHFMLPKNNLMAGRISPHNKLRILGILQQIIQSEGRALLEIPIDDLGSRLQSKMTMGETFQFHETPAMMYAKVSTVQIVNTAIGMSINQKCLLESMPDGNKMVYKRLSVFLSKLTRAKDSNSLEISAVKLLAPLLSSSLGSVKASHDIYTSHSISPEAHCQFSAGLNSDVASGSLKLASALNCVGDMEKAESVLRNTEEKYDLNTVEPICMCYLHPMPDPNPKQKFKHKCITGNEEVIQHITAFCVRFLRCEIYCVPKELQYEMFRSTLEDRPERDERVCFRMDWAVVDSLPYLYFLQYKTYGALKRVADQHCALVNLVTSIETESNLCHRETALNLLGQCMEQKNKHNDALCCYMKSLNIQARNNAAKVLICRLLNELVNKHEPSLN